MEWGPGWWDRESVRLWSYRVAKWWVRGGVLRNGGMTGPGSGGVWVVGCALVVVVLRYDGVAGVENVGDGGMGYLEGGVVRIGVWRVVAF